MIGLLQDGRNEGVIRYIDIFIIFTISDRFHINVIHDDAFS